MFESENIKSLCVTISDPGADDKQIHLWRAPVAAEFLRGYIVCQNAQGEGSAGVFTLQNWGTAGTAAGGTVFASKGGTATSARLSAETPYALTLSEGTFAAGEWLVLDYQETGDWVEGQVSFVLDYVLGIGA